MITAFYHVWGSNHWREIVSEQLRLLGTARFPGTVHIHYTGADHWEQGFIQRVADVHGLQIEFLPSQPGRYEAPAIEAAQHYALGCDPAEHILYFHNKGCGNPNSWRHVMWRWMMNSYILTNWEKSLAVLQTEGLDWVATQTFGPPITHGAGNFWIATSAHLRRLEHFPDYHATFLARFCAHGPHWMEQRHADEAWIGSHADARYCSLMPDAAVELSNYRSWCEHIDMQEDATRYGS